MYQLVTFAALLFFVALHEFGHLLVARACKVRVTDYSIGFGKTLYSFRWKNINWYIKLIPLGGYVKMPGMIRPDHHRKVSGNLQVSGKSLTENQQMDYLYALAKDTNELEDNWATEVKNMYAPDTFHRANIFKRLAILSGGCAVNIITAALLIFVSVWAFTPVMSERWELQGFSGKYQASYGQYVGERMVQFNNDGYMQNDGQGQKLATFDAPKGHYMIVLENGTKLYIDAKDENAVRLAKVASERIGYKDIPLGVAASYSWDTVKNGFTKVATFLPDFFSKKEVREQTSSAIGMVSEAPSQKANFLWYLGIISLSLGIFNLLPLLPLDGGQILFNIAQSLRLPAGEKSYAAFALAGLSVFAMILITAVSNDIQHLLH